jgi:uncharacterized protein YbbC (DUF1343 family)
MQKAKSLIVVVFALFTFQACLQNPQESMKEDVTELLTAAQQTASYLPLLEGKRVALVANHSSLIDDIHLADSLLALDVDIVKVLAPEHGFRGMADAGEHVADGKDVKTQLPVISLYGTNRKPNAQTLKGIDLILFDLQDVGTRFYTYISTLTFVMETAAEQGIPVLVLDRPNPNGFYIDGPVMEKEHSSFVGLHPVPIVYGMTIGEYGLMVNGEYWLADSLQCELKVIPLTNYDRNKLYKLPIKPSPNLPNWQSVYLYPSLCLFEGTVVSAGRGTDAPFTLYGHPDFHIGSFAFTPEPRPGAQHPKLEGIQCFGQNLIGYADQYEGVFDHLNLQWLTSAYEVIGNDSTFFIPYFENLAGTSNLRKQIISGASIGEIKASWQDDLDKFKRIRNKYLIYKDFE